MNGQHTEIVESQGPNETVHRVILAILISVTVASLVLTYRGIDAYLNSGRSVYSDAKTATGYQWKANSCSDLWKEVVVPAIPQYPLEKTVELCRIARENSLPPFALQRIIKKESPGQGAISDPALARSFVEKCGTVLAKELSELRTVYGTYKRRIFGMWFFLLAAAVAIGSFYYARRYTPVLFGHARERFNGILFGKNKYTDAIDNFLGKNKK